MTTLPTPVAETAIGPALDLEAVAARAAGLARQARAVNTIRAYEADWREFAGWCADRGLEPLPAAPAVVGLYLADCADRLSLATLARRVSSLAARHRRAGLGLDVRHPAVADVLAGLRRERGSAQRRAEALTVPRLKQVLAGLGDGLADRRDRALLLVGTAAALRRSELAALDVADIAVLPEGLRVTIRRSKTDAEGRGAVLAVGRTGQATCPAAAYTAWLAATGIAEGAAFRAVDRHGRLGGRLSGNAVALIVQRRAGAAGLDAAAYAGHSMRAGFATSAAHAGVGEIRIAHQTRHASLSTLRRYVREGALFADNLTVEIGL